MVATGNLLITAAQGDGLQAGGLHHALQPPVVH